MLVGGVVVDDEVDIEIARHRTLDALEKGQELLVAMARPALGQHCPLATSRAANSVVVPCRL
jgi:hypothetical protein